MLSIIVATDINGGIGKDNQLLFHIPEDLQRFKNLTTDHTIVMGRRTFESLPNGALPNRTNIVLTKNGFSFYKDNEEEFDTKDLFFCESIDSMIDIYKDSEKEAFIIGGGQIYEQLLPYCDRIYLTQVNTKAKADTFFKFNKNDWEEESREIKHNGKLYYGFINLKRKVK